MSEWCYATGKTAGDFLLGGFKRDERGRPGKTLSLLWSLINEPESCGTLGVLLRMAERLNSTVTKRRGAS